MNPKDELLIGTMMVDELAKNPICVPLYNAMNLLATIYSKDPDFVIEATNRITGDKVMVTKYDFEIMLQKNGTVLTEHDFIGIDGNEVRTNLLELDILLTNDLLDKASQAILNHLQYSVKGLTTH